MVSSQKLAGTKILKLAQESWEPQPKQTGRGQARQTESERIDQRIRAPMPLQIKYNMVESRVNARQSGNLNDKRAVHG